MTGGRLDVKRRAGRDLDHHARLAWEQADRQAQRVQEATGLDMIPRGQALVDYVAQQMQTAAPAYKIAQGIGYLTPDRVAANLARVGHAPLARALLARAAADEAYGKPATRKAPRPEPEQVWATRPSPAIAELLDELEDAAARGADWETVAHMYAIQPDTLVRRIQRADQFERVRSWHPTFRRTASPKRMRGPVGLCPQGHPIVIASDGARHCRPCEVAA